jgi:hypothetical protein
MEPKDKEFPEGHFVGLWIGLGIAIFSGLGIPLSVATENYAFIGVGPALGVAFGAAIGQAIENKYTKEGRIIPRSKEEGKWAKIATLAGLVLLLLGVLFFLLLFFSAR